MALIADAEHLQYNLEIIEQELAKINMEINIQKTKITIISKREHIK